MTALDELKAEVRALRGENSRLRTELADANGRLALVAHALRVPAPPPRKIADESPERIGQRQLNAMRSQCYVGKLGDEARRKALNRAYSAGAIEPVMDEMKLQWRSTVLAIDRSIDPIRAETITDAVGCFFDLSDLERNFWIMSRLARLARNWAELQPSILSAWYALRARAGDPDEPFHGDNNLCLADEAKSHFPDGRPAVTRTHLYLHDSTPLKQHERWISPSPLSDGPRLAVFDQSSEELSASQLHRNARKRSRKRTRVALHKLAIYPVEIQALALMEIAYF